MNKIDLLYERIAALEDAYNKERDRADAALALCKIWLAAAEAVLAGDPPAILIAAVAKARGHVES